MMTVKTFVDRLSNGDVLVSDGATGTNLQSRGLATGTSAEVWVLERPDEIKRLHSDFIAAGSDLILTCTFGGTSVRLEQSGLGGKVEQVNRTAVELAKQAVGDLPVLVAGSVGPTGHLMEPLGPLSRDEAVKNYSEQAQILATSGVDLIVIETQFDLAEAEAAVQGVRAVTNLPLVCSFSYDRGTRSMMGVRPAQTVEMLQKMDVSAIGINCGRSLTENGDALKQLAAVTSLPIWFKPNAGLPQLDAVGNPTYSLTPDDMGSCVSDWIDAGARIIGGCCGTSPAHLQAIAQAVKSRKAIQ